MRAFVGIALALVIACAIASTAAAQSLRGRLVATGFTRLIYAASPPNDLQRMFVVEQTGKIKILRNGSVLATPFLDLGTGGLNKIQFAGERGLLGLAFHPNFASNGYVFVNYIAAGSGASVIERYTVSAGNPDVANPASGLVFLTVAQPQDNHNGGCIQFGPDGKLYIGMGDGGGAADTGPGHAPVGNGQSLATLHGKILRLDVNLPAPHIPPDNPYFGSPNALGEIWHRGVRNPWRWSFDSLTGEMYLGDVGEAAWEEVSVAPPGAPNLNFGWRCMEGFSCTGLSGCTCNAVALTRPVHAYPGSQGCAVIGGYVYRGSAICGLQGTYFFGDYCSSRIWSFRLVGGQVTEFVDRTPEIEPAGGSVSLATLSSFAVDGAGELYVLDYTDGDIYRIENSVAQPDCDADGSPDACELAAGTEQDCNANNVPDSCEIASGLERDCNGDGTPDSCEIAADWELDWNQNGSLDSCECPGGAPPVAYCTAKVNSLGCTPYVQSTGYPSASLALPFWIGAKKMLSQKTGMMMYGYWVNPVPFQGGWACVGAPIRRMPPRPTGGSQTTVNCSGLLVYEFNTYIASGVDPALQLGQELTLQFWCRDPGASFGASLSNALRARICQ